MTDRHVPHFPAVPGTAEQDPRRQGALFAHRKILQSGSCAAAVGGHDHRTERYGARSVLSPAFFTSRQGEGRDGDSPQDYVLFYNTLKHGIPAQTIKRSNIAAASSPI
jgi:hypothetical protein